MNTGVKLVIGLLLVIAGVAWYWYGEIFTAYAGVSSLTALLMILAGSVGVFIFLIGLLVVWVEVEEIKDARREKKMKKGEKKEPAVEKPKPAKKTKKKK